MSSNPRSQSQCLIRWAAISQCRCDGTSADRAKDAKLGVWSMRLRHRYGELPPCPNTSHAANPISRSRRQLASEYLHDFVYRCYGLERLFAYFNIFGPRQDQRLVFSVLAKFITRCSQRAADILGDGKQAGFHLH